MVIYSVCHLTLLMYLLLCCWVVSVELLLRPGDARLWPAVIKVPAPGRSEHVLLMLLLLLLLLMLHWNNLVRHQKLVLKVPVLLQPQNILDGKGRRGGGWTGMHPLNLSLCCKLLFKKKSWYLRTVLELLVMVTLRLLLTDWWVDGLGRMKSFKGPAEEQRER